MSAVLRGTFQKTLSMQISTIRLMGGADLHSKNKCVTGNNETVIEGYIANKSD